jgi:hypothetical protein
MADSKVWWQSRTVWLQIVVFLVGLLTLIKSMPLDEQELGVVVILLSILAIAVRFLTGVPVTLTDVNKATGNKIPPAIQADTEKILDDLETEAGTAPAEPPAPPGVG